MNLLRKRWLLLAAALPLLYLPLRAAEPPAAGDSPPADTADTEEPVPLPAAETQAEETAEPAEEPAASRSASQPSDAARDEGEQLSLDNNLSFPVDI